MYRHEALMFCMLLSSGNARLCLSHSSQLCLAPPHIQAGTSQQQNKGSQAEVWSPSGQLNVVAQGRMRGTQLRHNV